MKIARQVALFVCLFALLLGSWFGPLDRPAMQQVDAGLKRALITFASARALNGVISVIQGTLVDAQPAGMGFTFAPGQLLAPINEVVKQFSDLMLMASVAFGIQKMLISISGYWVIKVILTATALVWAMFHFREQRPPGWISKFLVLLLMLRFAIPVVTLGSDVLYQKFLKPEYTADQKAIDTTTARVDEEAAAGGGGWWDKIKGLTPTMPDVKAKMEAMKNLPEHIVKLMVIFLLQTLVMPLFLLWGLYAIARSMFDLRLSPKLKS